MTIGIAIPKRFAFLDLTEFGSTLVRISGHGLFDHKFIVVGWRGWRNPREMWPSSLYVVGLVEPALVTTSSQEPNLSSSSPQIPMEDTNWTYRDSAIAFGWQFVRQRDIEKRHIYFGSVSNDCRPSAN